MRGLCSAKTRPCGIPFFAAVVLLLLGGCGNVSYTLKQEPEPERTATNRFEPLPGRGPEVVAALRTGPAPAEPQIANGKQFAADRRGLAARGYMVIGNAHLTPDNASIRSTAIKAGVTAGADKVLLYPPEGDASPNEGAPGDDMSGTWLAVYYVRVKPPFGATFRDLSAAEQAEIGVSGGVRIGSVIGDTPASRANLLHDDVIVKIDHQPIAGKAMFQNVLKERVGKRVILTIRRNGETLKRIVRLGLLPSMPPS
ncbi:MAG: PDZ domain-containing protein [Rhodanobacteraceae bacterium]